jgi:outer membrane protein OmpA-like peptidoglycan-associated protein
LAANSNSIITVSMTLLSKSRISLIGFCFLALGGCAGQGPDQAVWQATKDAASAVGNVFASDTPKQAAIDAPDPGDTPYPNLAVVPRRPTRPDAQTLQSEQAALAGQRRTAQSFDAQVRAIDPILDPTSRPPEPPPVAAVLAAPVASAPVASAPPVVFAPPVSAVGAAPTIAPATPPVMAPTRPSTVPQTANPAGNPAASPAPRPAAVQPRPSPNTAWLVGEVTFADGSPLLTAEARRTLRNAVAAANEQGGAVRVTPNAVGVGGPHDNALAPRRMAAVAGELEALGLSQDKIRIDPGSYRAARVAVEF